MLRGRAWDLAATVPDGLGLDVPIQELAGRDDVEVVVMVRRRGPPLPPPLATLPLEPLQRYLAGCGLSDVERAILAVLLQTKQRLTTRDLLPAVSGRLGRQITESFAKPLLARMTDESVAILDNVKTGSPSGYQVTQGYREFLAWAERARDELTQPHVA